MSILSIEDIMSMLPHRYPFLLVDKVLECVPFESIVAVKNVTYNEPFFTGHFPKSPVMPGVLILESMAQATGVLAFHSARTTSKSDAMYYLVGVDKRVSKAPLVLVTS
jgi:3-hydroxyacyl-[acyl-carrier-protein] dehydratase